MSDLLLTMLGALDVLAIFSKNPRDRKEALMGASACSC